MQNRSRALNDIINIVLGEKGYGIPWDDLVDFIARGIDAQAGYDYRIKRLKRTPSETTTETCWKGQKALARRYIDAAHRYGRITYLTLPDGYRTVLPGDPPTTGGRYAKPTQW